MKVSDEQLGTIIANKIKESGLNGVFDPSVLESIKQKVKAEYKKLRAIPLPEGEYRPSGDTFPYGEDPVETAAPSVPLDVAPAMEAGSEPTDQPYAPTVYTPDLPEVLRNVEPAKLVVLELNDIIENGENLANKPLRTMDNLDCTKSMQMLWSSDGVTKAEVFQIKFERIGEMTFDYASGTAMFTETPAPMEVGTAEPFRDNPYKEAPVVDGIAASPSAQDIETYVKTSVNVEDIIKKVAIDLMAKAYEEKAGIDAKEHMGLGPALVPTEIYESYQLGNAVPGVEFLGSQNGSSIYAFKGRTYIMGKTA